MSWRTLLLLMLFYLPATAQILTPPPDSGVVIDNAPALRRAKVVMNVEHDTLSGTLPTALYYMELLLSHYQQSPELLEMVALFHSTGGYLVLNDAAYNRFRHTSSGNPYKDTLARLHRSGVSLELCAYTAYTNHWVNADLLPGVKIDSDVLLRLIFLTQDGYVQIQP